MAPKKRAPQTADDQARRLRMRAAAVESRGAFDEINAVLKVMHATVIRSPYGSSKASAYTFFRMHKRF